MRQFFDRDGTRWDLFEVSSNTLSAGRADYLPADFQHGWLVFDNGSERRRYAPIPRDWASAPVTELYLILDAARRVQPRASNSRLSDLPRLDDAREPRAELE